jgi:transaldolase
MIPSGLKVELFADGAALEEMRAWYGRPWIRGFTTNPTLMRKAGVRDYRRFARDVVAAIPDRPISFEVFSDRFDEMECQAREIAEWGANVYVKVPVTDTTGRPSYDLAHRLSQSGVHVNVTAMLTLAQVTRAVDALAGGASSYVSIFAGRIADTGRDPVPIVRDAVAIAASAPSVRVIWASPRELLNVFHAEAAGCHVITMTTDLLGKLPLIGKDLDEFSLETVKMFRADAVSAGFTLSALGQLT